MMYEDPDGAPEPTAYETEESRQEATTDARADALNHARGYAGPMLRRQYPEFGGLSPAAKQAVLADFAALCFEEYDVGDPGLDGPLAIENTEAALAEYKRRIGAGNLVPYAASLLARRPS